MTRAIYKTIPVVFSACAAWAQSSPAPAFEVASIKSANPASTNVVNTGNGGRVMVRTGCNGDKGRLNCTNVTLKDVVGRAYGMKPYQISGPGWLESERYDITAKIPDGVAEDKVPEMLQGLLTDRCKMSVRRENKEQSIYALVVGKNGPKLKPAEETPGGAVMTAPDGSRINVPQAATTSFGASTSGSGSGGAKPAMMMMDSTGRMQVKGATMPSFCDMLTRFLDRPVFDMTSIEGRYDIALEVSMEDLVGMKRMAGGPGGAAMIHMGGGGAGGGSGPAPEGSPHGSIFSAVQQLGLKLDSRKAPVESIVIQSIEKPTEN